MKKFRKGDDVVVLTGRDKGKRGTVLRVLDEQRALVDNVNVAVMVFVCRRRVAFPS